MLLPLGLYASIVGLLQRSALAEGFVWFETSALIVIAAGMTAWQVGVCGAISVLWPRLAMEDESGFPVMLSGLPFFALGLGGAVLLLGCPKDWLATCTIWTLGGVYVAILGVGMAAGFPLSLLVPVVAWVRRRARRRND